MFQPVTVWRVVLPFLAVTSPSLTRATAPDASPRAPLRVLAPASLGPALSVVADAWRRADGRERVSVTAEATSRLARQVMEGAPADLFFSADEAWMDALAAQGHLEPGTRVVLLSNRLVVVVPRDAAVTPQALEELAHPRWERVALTGPSVPLGRYARAALSSAKSWDAVRPRLAEADNARAALAWVARGEADVGVVYETDARAEPRVRVAFVVPASLHPRVTYPAAVLRGATSPDTARAFLAFCRSPPAAALFRGAGFSVVEGP